MARTHNPQERQLAVCVPTDFAEQLSALARRRAISRSDLLRELLQLGLERYQRQQAILRAAEAA